MLYSCTHVATVGIKGLSWMIQKKLYYCHTWPRKRDWLTKPNPKLNPHEVNRQKDKQSSADSLHDRSLIEKRNSFVDCSFLIRRLHIDIIIDMFHDSHSWLTLYAIQAHQERFKLLNKFCNDLIDAMFTSQFCLPVHPDQRPQTKLQNRTLDLFLCTKHTANKKHQCRERLKVI